MFSEVTDELYDEKNDFSSETATPEHQDPKLTDSKQLAVASTSPISKSCSLCLVPSPSQRQKTKKKASRKVLNELPDKSTESIHGRGNCEGEKGVELKSFFRADRRCSELLPVKDQQVGHPPILKYSPTPTARNSLAQVMPGQMFSAGGAPPQQVQPLTASMLAAVPPQEQKQMLGQRLFPLIQMMVPGLASKITGMLLEINNAEVVHMLADHNFLKKNVEKAVAVLRADPERAGAKVNVSSLCSDILTEVIENVFLCDPFIFSENVQQENSNIKYKPLKRKFPCSGDRPNASLNKKFKLDSIFDSLGSVGIKAKVVGGGGGDLDRRQHLLDLPSVRPDHHVEAAADHHGSKHQPIKPHSPSKEDRLNKIIGSVFGKSTNSSTEEVHVHARNLSNCSSECETKTCYMKDLVVVNKIRGRFRNMSTSVLHAFLLSRLNSQRELGLGTSCSFVFEQTKFCHKAVMSLFNISKYMIGQVVKEHLSGQIYVVHGNKGLLYGSQKRDFAIGFVHNVSKLHAENLPDRTVLRLPLYLNIQELYCYYKDNVTKDLLLSERSFYDIFKKSFGDAFREDNFLPRIVFLPANSHPVCCECDRLSSLRKASKSESDMIFAMNCKKQHLLKVRRQYLQFSYRRELAIRFPGEYLHIGIDDVDQAKICSPFSPTITKDTSGLLRMNNHLCGVIVSNGGFSSDRRIMSFINSDQFPNDSNKTCEIFMKVLEFCQNKLGKLPKKLFVQTDNCSKDLKKQFVLAFYWTLVDMNIFEEIIGWKLIFSVYTELRNLFLNK